MRLLIISQIYYPDTASVSQHLTDLAESIAAKNNFVKVYSSRYLFEDNSKKLSRNENHNGVVIHRINNAGFGKKYILGRIIDILSFNLIIIFRLLFTSAKKYDAVLALTAPPLLGFVAGKVSKLKKWKFFYWGMDLQPELSIQSGLIRQRSLQAKLFTYMSDSVFRNADFIIALDKYMKGHMVRRGAREEGVAVIPVWPVMESVYEGDREANPFRAANQLGDKIVIMYSGNHSYVHPLDTLLNASKILDNKPEILFVFIGGGVRKKDVTSFRLKEKSENIIQLEYQPRNTIHLSLGASDFQVVILGEGMVGYTHPNKIYGAMFIGKPIIYIGPKESHIVDILTEVEGNIMVEHGEAELLALSIDTALSKGFDYLAEVGRKNADYAAKHFHPDHLKNETSNFIVDQFQ